MNTLSLGQRPLVKNQVMDLLAEKDLFFKTEAKPLFFRTEDGRSQAVDNRKLITRVDNGGIERALGVVSDRYALMENEVVFEGLADIIAESDIDTADMDARVTLGNHGAKTMVELILPSYKVTTGTGDDTVFRIVALNSYDGSFKFSVHAGGFRMMCLNGQILGNHVGYFGHKHVGKSNHIMDKASASVGNLVRAFRQDSSLWRQWSKKTVRDEDARKVLALLARDDKYLSGKIDEPNNLMRKLLKSWQEYQGTLGSTAWGLYNVMTDWSTHAHRSGDAVAGVQRRTSRVREVMQHSDFKVLAA